MRIILSLEWIQIKKQTNLWIYYQWSAEPWPVDLNFIFKKPA